MPNNFASAITTEFLADGVIVPLQSRLAPLNAFTKQYEPDPVKPLATVEIKVAASGSSTNVDPSDFTANSGTRLNAAAVTMHQLSHPFSLSNKDLNSGVRLRDLFEININKFSQTLLNTVLAPVTSINFPIPPLLSSAAAFSLSDLDTLWAAICKSKDQVSDPGGQLLRSDPEQARLLLADRHGIRRRLEALWLGFHWPE